jgi:hypothetical protein
MHENPPPMTENAPAETVPEKPARNRGGAPLGNQNRMAHGLKASKLPKEAKAEECAGYAFRTMLMEALEAIHGKGKVPVMLQAMVQTAHRRELEARLAARWLRREAKLTLQERLSLAATITSASEARDKIIAKLGLDRGRNSAGDDSESAWDEFDRSNSAAALPDATEEVEAIPGTTQPAASDSDASGIVTSDASLPAEATGQPVSEEDYVM